ncbi:MAG: restriction endonuclease subunit S [Saprospirales bacterium]|nr:restriction endonuclease subunit S [Saprospirales bacterium]
MEWIGEVPRGWEVKRLKHICKIYGRIGYRGYTTEDIVDEGGGAISLSPSNVVNHQLTLQKCTYISWDKYYESPEIMIFPSDIVLVKTGSTIGKTALIPKDTPKMTLNPQLVALKDISVFPEYLYYSMTCEFFQGYLLTETVGGSTPTISQEKVLNFPIISPPSVEEQEEISRFLLEQTFQIDTLIHQEQHKITLLKEYRQALRIPRWSLAKLMYEMPERITHPRPLPRPGRGAFWACRRRQSGNRLVHGGRVKRYSFLCKALPSLSEGGAGGGSFPPGKNPRT